MGLIRLLPFSYFALFLSVAISSPRKQPCAGAQTREIDTLSTLIEKPFSVNVPTTHKIMVLSHLLFVALLRSPELPAMKT